MMGLIATALHTAKGVVTADRYNRASVTREWSGQAHSCSQRHWSTLSSSWLFLINQISGATRSQWDADAPGRP